MAQTSILVLQGMARHMSDERFAIASATLSSAHKSLQTLSQRASGVLCKAELSWPTCGRGALSEGLIQRWWTAAPLLAAAALASAMRALMPRCISSSPAQFAWP